MSTDQLDTGEAESDFEPVPGPESLPRDLQDLGLSPYEARVIVTLMQLGSANTLQIAQSSGVPRTSTYQVLEALGSRRLAFRLPGDGPAVWSPAGRDEIIERLQLALEAEQQERLREHRAKAARLRKLFEEVVPEHPSPSLPFVHIIHGRAPVKQAYDRMLANSTSEFVVFNRPPYSWEPGVVNPVIIGNVRRGVHTRALYQAVQMSDPAWENLRRDIEAYHAVGVQGRVVERLGMKLAVADRRTALLALPDAANRDEGFPTNLLVEHEGFASLLADLFDMLWLNAAPYKSLPSDKHSEG